MLEKILEEERRRAWKRSLLSALALGAGALGFGGTVACAYGPGDAGGTCKSDAECRQKLGAGYYCDKVGSSYVTGQCRRRTLTDGLPDGGALLDGLPDVNVLPDLVPDSSALADVQPGHDRLPEGQPDRALTPDAPSPSSDRSPSQ
jgi:hypothetical protein